MESREQPTCGQGLAANAVLPAKLSEVFAAQPKVLERHMRALDPGDLRAKSEIDAYTKLVDAHHVVARALQNLAEQMRGYQGLPMADHNMGVMSDPRGQVEAFRQFVALEGDLATFLRSKVGEEQRLLA